MEGISMEMWLAFSAALAFFSLFTWVISREIYLAYGMLFGSVLLALYVSVKVLLGLPADTVSVYFLPGSPALVGFDSHTAVLLAASSTVWLLALLHFQRFESIAREYLFTLALIAVWIGNMGAVLAITPELFYTCFSIAGIAGWGLIYAAGSADQRPSSLYLGYVIMGEVFLAGFLFFVGANESGTFAMLLAMLGFGVKIGLFPLHASLPIAYGNARGLGPVVFAGALINMGVIGILRFVPFGSEESLVVGIIWQLLGAIGMLYGLICGMLQRNPGALLGYSSMTQMGALSLLFGAALLTPEWAPTLLMGIAGYAAFHGITKALLVLSADQMRYFRRGESGHYLYMGVLILAGLTLAGLPLTFGAVAKTELKEGVKLVGEGGLTYLSAGLTALSFCSLLLMGRLFQNVWGQESDEVAGKPVWIPLLVFGITAVFAMSWMFEHSALKTFAVSQLYIVYGAMLILFTFGRWFQRQSCLLPAGDFAPLFYDSLEALYTRIANSEDHEKASSNQIKMSLDRDDFYRGLLDAEQVYSKSWVFILLFGLLGGMAVFLSLL